MSKHREILPEVITLLGKEWPECRIVLLGSVQRGEERPDSDLDLIIIRRAGGDRKTDHSRIHSEISLCLTFYGAKWLEQSICKQPYWYYPFAYSEIQRDPDGLANRLQEITKRFFDSHPQVLDAWKNQTRQYLRTRTKPNFKMDYPNWKRFFQHLETLDMR
jgi:predicted nucleotidyltransferase